MDSPNWNGFFPHGMYGGLAFWVNLSILLFPFYDIFKFQRVLDKDYVAIAVVVIAIVILLTGYIIEEICFFCMKVFATPVKWYYNIIVEILRSESDEKSDETINRIWHQDKIKTPDDAEIRFDEAIDNAWRNRFTVSLINSQIAFGLFFSWIVIGIIALNNAVFIVSPILFFLVIPVISHLLNILINNLKSEKDVKVGLEKSWGTISKHGFKGIICKLCYNGLIFSAIAIALFIIIYRFVPIVTIAHVEIISFKTFQILFNDYFGLIGLIEAIIAFVLIYEANSINKIYGRYLYARGDYERINKGKAGRATK